MTGGPESGGEHQFTDRERESIEHNMPEGSLQAKASADREEWHLRAELNNPAAVNDILALQFNRIPDAKSGRTIKVFVGEVQGHSVQIQVSATEENTDKKYMGRIDGNNLDPSDAEKMFHQFLTIKEEGQFIDPGNIKKIDSEHKIAKKAAEDIFGRKE